MLFEWTYVIIFISRFLKFELLEWVKINMPKSFPLKFDYLTEYCTQDKVKITYFSHRWKDRTMLPALQMQSVCERAIYLFSAIRYLFFWEEDILTTTASLQIAIRKRILSFQTGRSCSLDKKTFAAFELMDAQSGVRFVRWYAINNLQQLQSHW